MLKWIGRILGIIGGLIALLVLILVAVVGFDAVASDGSGSYTNVSFTASDGTELRGYLAEPAGEGPHPSILLIHEWWGFNEGMTVLADSLAEEGYLVLAADAYRGRVTARVPRALYMTITTPQERIQSDLDDALDYLQGLPNADVDRTATMGFCFGGGQSLQLGLRESERLAVTVVYYGALVTNPDLLRPFTDGQAVLGIFGEEDQQIFVEDVIEFEAALNSLDINNQITIYADVGHAFLNEENFKEPGQAGDAWQETLIFLDENLK